MANELRAFDPDDLTIRGAVALAALAAEHVASQLEGYPAARTAVQNALRDDWSWLETESPGARKLYDDHMGTLWEEDSELGEGSPALPAFHCGLHAHQYAIWNVEGSERVRDPEVGFWLPEDMHEVDDSDLQQCLEQAVALSPEPERTTAWLNELIDRLERDQPISEDDPIGPPMRRDDFSMPELG
jgi:hypothetical protein